MNSRAILIFLLLSSSAKSSKGTLTSSFYTETSQDLSILKGIRGTLLEMNLVSCAMVCLPDETCFGIGVKPPKCVLLKLPLLDFTWQTMEKGYKWFLKEDFDFRKNCSDGEQSMDGVYLLRQDGLTLETAYCRYLERCGWQLIQKNIGGSVDFNRSWTDYKHGFGILFEEFWLGNDNIHNLTKNGNTLKIEVEDNKGNGKSMKYTRFLIGDEDSHYQLSSDMKVEQAPAGDSLSANMGMPFSTYDNDTAGHCASVNGGGWWYTNCGSSNLNGELPPANGTSGIRWDTWQDQAVIAYMNVRTCEPVHQFTLW